MNVQPELELPTNSSCCIAIQFSLENAAQIFIKIFLQPCRWQGMLSVVLAGVAVCYARFVALLDNHVTQKVGNAHKRMLHELWILWKLE